MAKEYKLSLTAEKIDETLKRVSGTVTTIDFSNIYDGSFTEVVDGEEVSHSVTFDESGWPATVDGVTIEWPEEVVKYLTADEVQEMIDTSLGVIENGAY